MEKKSNASSPVILLLSVFFIFTESIRIFTGEKEPYYTEDMQLIWLTGAWFLVIAALLLACFILVSGEKGCGGTGSCGFP